MCNGQNTILCNRKPHKRPIFRFLVALLSAEFKDLKISQEPRDVCAGIQARLHNEEQLFHAAGSEAPPPLEATAISAQFFTERHKSPVTCAWL